MYESNIFGAPHTQCSTTTNVSMKHESQDFNLWWVVGLFPSFTGTLHATNIHPNTPTPQPATTKNKTYSSTCYLHCLGQLSQTQMTWAPNRQISLELCTPHPTHNPQQRQPRKQNHANTCKLHWATCPNNSTNTMPNPMCESDIFRNPNGQISPKTRHHRTHQRTIFDNPQPPKTKPHKHTPSALQHRIDPMNHEHVEKTNDAVVEPIRMKRALPRLFAHFWASCPLNEQHRNPKLVIEKANLTHG